MNDVELRAIASLLPVYRHDLALNSDLIEILEGNLFKFLDQLLKTEFVDPKTQAPSQSYGQALSRAAPVNFLTKMIDKLSVIYSPAPSRTIENANASDKKMFDWYVANSNINDAMKNACELYNTCRSTILHPLVDKGKLFIRVLDNDKFYPSSSNPINPLCPTNITVIECGGPEPELTIWSDENVYRTDAEGNIDAVFMAAIDNPSGENVYRQLPFIYINSSKRRLVPRADVDLFKMTTLIPLMITDLNFAVKFQCFSIIYTINVADNGQTMSPCALWTLTTEATSDAKPEVGVIKPQVDIDQVQGLIQSVLALFLNTRGIRPGAVGKLDGDNFANGISKIIDEMDTIELRRKLVEVFKAAEEQLWNFIIHVAHPIWIRDDQSLIPFAKPFSANCEVNVNFAEQITMSERGQLVKDQSVERQAGFTTRKRAIAKINPEMTEQEVDELMKEIDDEHEMATSGSSDTEGLESSGPGQASGPVYRGNQTEE